VRSLPGIAQRAKPGCFPQAHLFANDEYVYLLESIAVPEQTYVGLTDHVQSRLEAHNAGQSPHTAKFKPWRLKTYIAFADEKKAIAFERYLKSHSGRAFARKRLR